MIGPAFPYIIAFASLVANATATGSVLMANHYQIVVTDNPLTLMLETLFFLVLALLILVKLLDKVVWERLKSKNEGPTKGNVQEKRGKSKGSGKGQQAPRA